MRVEVDGLLAQKLADVLVGGLLVAAQVQELVAVADDGLPLLVEQRPQLRHVLDDDRRGHPAPAHGGEYLLKIIG